MSKYFMLTVRPLTVYAGIHRWCVDEFDGRGWLRTYGHKGQWSKMYAQQRRALLRRRLMRQGLKPWKGKK